MNFNITTFFKTHWAKIFSVFFFVVLSISYVNTFAVFTPGQTLDPNCSPGAGGCYVSAGFSGSGDFAGVAGGQTLNGGANASDNLTLSSTAHATKGKILFGTSAYNESNNRLGIGTATPAYELDVLGSAQVSGNIYWANSTASVGVIYKGGFSFISDYKDAGASASFTNVFIGKNAGNFTMTSGAIRNIALGEGNLAAVTSGSSNTAIGWNAATLLTTGNQNTMIGYRSSEKLTTGLRNTTVGVFSGNGFNLSEATGSDNTYIGNSAGLYTSTAGSNTSLGSNALRGATSGITGSNNTAVGVSSLLLVTSGNLNTAMGTFSQSTLTTGVQNTSFGSSSLLSLSTGSENTAIGYRAGNDLSSGSFNIVIGGHVNLPSNTGSNQLNIGNLIYGTGIYGHASVMSSTPAAGSIGIGSYTFDATNPEKLLVAAGTTTSVNAIKATGTINNYFQLNIQNQSSGTSASSDIVATADNGSETTGYIDMGINSSGNTAAMWGTANDAYLYNMGAGSGGKLYIGTGTASQSLVFMMGGSAATNEYMRVDGATGAVVVGAGTAASTNIFQVTKTSTSNTILTGLFSNPTVNRSSNSSTRFVGIDASPIIGATNTANFTGIAGTSGLLGIRSYPSIASGATGTLSRFSGLSTGFTNNSAMNVSLAYGLYIDAFNNIGAGTISQAVGIAISDNSSSAAEYAAILIGDTLPPSGIWSIYDNSGADSYLEGKLAVNLSSLAAPTYSLDVGNNVVSGIVARFTNSSGSCTINPTSSSVNCTSDMNLKKNITTLADNAAFQLSTIPQATTILDKVLSLTPVSYNWNTELDTDSKHTGFIAQQVEQVFPGLVATDPLTGLKSVNYMGFAPYTVQAIKEVDVKIKGLSSLDTTIQGSLGSLIKQFFADQSQLFKEATIGVLRINDQVCVDDVCATKEEFKALLLKSKQEYAGSHQGQPTPDPIPDPIVTPEDSSSGSDDSTVINQTESPSNQTGDGSSQSEDSSGSIDEPSQQ